MLFGLFDDDSKKEDLSKVKSENDRVLEEMKNLSARLGEREAQDQDDLSSQRKFLDNLRREGKGPSL